MVAKEITGYVLPKMTFDLMHHCVSVLELIYMTLASDYVRHIPPNAINWYPGHMQKGLKEIQARLADVDVIIEIHDARLPLTGRCQFVRDVSQIRPHILILNKSDLAERIVDVTEHKRLFTEDQSLGPYFQPPAEIFFANLKHPERQKRLLRQLLSRYSSTCVYGALVHSLLVALVMPYCFYDWPYINAFQVLRVYSYAVL
ncbi:unnamed protein product [Mesocestoides corti]|uniref:G domain-containing protein n=1 Tax=Mesocestoides corti TaxID=53468 RepID=A0A0R3UPT6_MESCO|nr:unnamed protein product [Mesocestoides corti]